MGDTGNFGPPTSTGEVRRNGQRTDPEAYYPNLPFIGPIIGKWNGHKRSGNVAKKQSQKKRPQKQKIEWRRVFVAGLAVVMALLLPLPMISMIAGGVGAVTQARSTR